jgi:hypothetical protein
MTSLDYDLRQRARQAYERARWLDGVRGAWPVVVLVPLALALHGPATAAATAMAATLLTAALATAGWRGGAWRRGALPGVIAGLPMFLAPSVLMPAHASCGAACMREATPWLTCFAGCGAAALAGGLVLAALARRDRAPLPYAASALVMAVLTASMTCTLAGTAGLVGAVAGLALGSAPMMASTLRASTR